MKFLLVFIWKDSPRFSPKKNHFTSSDHCEILNKIDVLMIVVASIIHHVNRAYLCLCLCCARSSYNGDTANEMDTWLERQYGGLTLVKGTLWVTHVWAQ